MSKIEVYDIENLANCFTVTYLNIYTKKVTQFVIHKDRNDFNAFIEFTSTLEGMIGFNNVGYDYPVIHPFLSEPDKYKDLDGDKIAKLIYKRAQQVIDWGKPDSKAKKEFIKPLIPQRDLFLINHMNNRARSVSLKKLMIVLGAENVQEMSIDHTEKVTIDQVPLVLDYNLNDVEVTYQFYLKNLDKIKLRSTIGKLLGKDVGNANNGQIGESLFFKRMSERTGVPEKIYTSGRTHRANILASECIIPNIEFKSPEFKQLLTAFKKMVVSNTKSQNNMTYVFDGVTYDYGTGGLHALRAPGIYKNVLSADVSSYYPNLAISQRFYPDHLGEVFCDVYKSIYEDRKSFKKGTPENAAYKEALNIPFGQSNAEWSGFYDPSYFLKIVLNGQLLLTVLCERLTLSGAAKVIMANTDGIEVDLIDKDMFDKVCTEWQKEYSLSLEFNTYKTLAVRDVNSYIAVYENPTTGKLETKEKSAFEVAKEYHKDHSMRIVPIAVREYFVNGTPVEDMVKNCTDISLFLMGKRAKTGSLRYRSAKDSVYINEPLPKTIRYYLSETGGSIVKVTKEKKKVTKKTHVISPNQMGMFGVTPPSGNESVMVEKITNLHVGYRMTMFNKWIHQDFPKYKVDKRFYIRECKKLIDSVTNTQISL